MTNELDRAATAASDLLKALASPNRLKILCHLIEGEKSVGQIAALIGVRETTVSQHLALLRKDRLVTSRRAGQTIFYTLDSPAAARIIAVLYETFCAGGRSPDDGVPLCVPGPDAGAGHGEAHAEGGDGDGLHPSPLPLSPPEW